MSYAKKVPIYEDKAHTQVLTYQRVNHLSNFKLTQLLKDEYYISNFPEAIEAMKKVAKFRKLEC